MRLLNVAAVMLFAMPVSAHEFWISPEKYMIMPQDQLVADIRVGTEFKGSAYSYLPAKFERFDLVMDGKVTPVENLVGDRPALNTVAVDEGLVVVVHQTTDYSLTYTDPSKFEDFVTNKDFRWVLEEHAARGLPDSGFREFYSRYGKSLIAVGDGAGSDSAVGMETEIVALANPYTEDVSKGLPVKVLYQGEPRTNTQVELFVRAPDGSVTGRKMRTDDWGNVTIPVIAGHEYLVDAVVMRAMEPEADNDPVWESLWASLTFKVPAK